MPSVPNSPIGLPPVVWASENNHELWEYSDMYNSSYKEFERTQNRTLPSNEIWRQRLAYYACEIHV